MVDGCVSLNNNGGGGGGKIHFPMIPWCGNRKRIMVISKKVVAIV